MLIFSALFILLCSAPKQLSSFEIRLYIVECIASSKKILETSTVFPILVPTSTGLKFNQFFRVSLFVDRECFIEIRPQMFELFCDTHTTLAHKRAYQFDFMPYVTDYF